MHSLSTFLTLTPSLSAGCSPPTPPVNGSVGEFTSSRVGAQVTYSCDTDLGERVATCSLPSLQWIPSSDDSMCIQPPKLLDVVYTVMGSRREARLRGLLFMRTFTQRTRQLTLNYNTMKLMDTYSKHELLWSCVSFIVLCSLEKCFHNWQSR